MPTKGTAVRGIRLPDGVWLELDERAQELDMSRNAYIVKLLTKRLHAECEVPDSDENVHIPNGRGIVRMGHKGNGWEGGTSHEA